MSTYDQGLQARLAARRTQRARRTAATTTVKPRNGYRPDGTGWYSAKTRDLDQDEAKPRRQTRDKQNHARLEP